jgi:hypothetical protein
MGKANQTLIGIAPAVATVSLLDYFFAADMLINLEYRLEKLISFSRRSIRFIHEQWGVPEPLNYVLFVLISLVVITLTQKILGRFIRSKKGGETYRYNQPDYSEVGVLVNSVRKVQEEITEMRKALSSNGLNLQGGPQPAIEEKLTLLIQKMTTVEEMAVQIQKLKKSQKKIKVMLQ